MVRVSSPAKLRPWSELTAKMVMGVVPGLVTLCSAMRVEANNMLHLFALSCKGEFQFRHLSFQEALFIQALAGGKERTARFLHNTLTGYNSVLGTTIAKMPPL